MPHESPQMKPKQTEFLIDPPYSKCCFLGREEAIQELSQVRTERHILVKLKNRVTSDVFVFSTELENSYCILMTIPLKTFALTCVYYN